MSMVAGLAPGGRAPLIPSLGSLASPYAALGGGGNSQLSVSLLGGPFLSTGAPCPEEEVSQKQL